MKQFWICKGIGFLLVASILLSPLSIFSQGYRSFRWEQEQIIERSLFEVGPFRVDPLIRFRNIGYDDNVYYQREEEEPIQDYTATFSPELNVHLLFHDFLILSFTENPEYVFYYKEERERRWNNTWSPEVKLLLLNRFVLSGSYRSSDRRRRATSEFDVRANEVRKRYRGSLFYETARRTSFGVVVESEEILYEDITLPGEEIYLSRRLNREEREGQFEFYYRIFSKSFLFIRGGYTEYNFKHPQASWRDSYSYQGYMGIQFPLLGKIRGVVSLGYKELLPRSEGKKSFSGLVGDTRVDFRVGRFRFRLRYNRDARFSYWTNNIYYIEDRYGAGLSFYLTRFLRLDYNFDYREGNYPEEMTLRLPGGDSEVLQREDQYFSHSAGFVVRLIQNTGIGFTVNFWERDSNVYWANKDRIFVGGYLTYEF